MPPKKKKGLTQAQLIKATRALIEDDRPKQKAKAVKKKVDNSTSFSPSLQKLVFEDIQSTKKENARLVREIKKLKVKAETTIPVRRVISHGTESGGIKGDVINYDGEEGKEEGVDMDVSNIPRSLSNYIHSTVKDLDGKEIDQLMVGDEEEDDEGVLETIGSFVQAHEVEIGHEAYKSLFTVDTCFFGNKPQPYNSQPIENYQEKFEIIDYQLPDIPSAKDVAGEKSFTVPLITHFKLTEIITHRANFQMHNLDSLITAGFHQHEETLSMCYATQVIFSSQPIELGPLAIFTEKEGQALIDRENPISSLEFQERASMIPGRSESFLYYKQTITRVTNVYTRKIDGNKVQTFTPTSPPFYEIMQSYEIGFQNMAMQSFVPGENIHGLIRLSYQNTSMKDDKDVTDGSDLVCIWFDVDMPKIQIDVLYHLSYIPLSHYYDNELWDSQTVSERGRSGTLTISGMGLSKHNEQHVSGIVSNVHSSNVHKIVTDRLRLNNLVSGAINKRGVMVFIGRDVQTIKGPRSSHSFDKFHAVKLHPLEINLDDILNFGKKIVGFVSMFLPFRLLAHKGSYRRVRADDKTAVILPNIPTTVVTDEHANINGCVAVGSKSPLPIITGFINSEDKIVYVTEKVAGLPTEEFKKDEVEVEDE